MPSTPDPNLPSSDAVAPEPPPDENAASSSSTSSPPERTSESDEDARCAARDFIFADSRSQPTLESDEDASSVSKKSRSRDKRRDASPIAPSAAANDRRVSEASSDEASSESQSSQVSAESPQAAADSWELPPLKRPGFFGRSLRVLVLLAFMLGQVAILLAVLLQLRNQSELTAALTKLSALDLRLAEQERHNGELLVETKSLSEKIGKESDKITSALAGVGNLSKLDSLADIRTVLNENKGQLPSIVAELQKLNSRGLPGGPGVEGNPPPAATGGPPATDKSAAALAEQVSLLLEQWKLFQDVAPKQAGHLVAVAISHCPDFDARLIKEELAAAYQDIPFRNSHPRHRVGLYYLSDTLLTKQVALADYPDTSRFVSALEPPDKTISSGLDNGLAQLDKEFGPRDDQKGKRHIIVLARDTTSPPRDSPVWKDVRFDAILFHQQDSAESPMMTQWNVFCSRHDGVVGVQVYQRDQDAMKLQDSNGCRQLLSRLWMPD